MTFTFNGFGTTYTRGERRFDAPGRCRACGRFAPLAAYDTHLAVALLYIPTFRLKPLRVMAQCSGCEHHLRMDHAAWVAAKDAAKDALTKARAPKEIGAAFAGLAALADPAEIATVIDDVRAAVGDDAEGLALVGGGLAAVGDLSGAKAALERSLAAGPSTEAALQLGFVELCRDDPLAAHGHLECVWRNRVRDGVDLALLLIDCLLAHGEQALALRVAERLPATFPDLADHRELRDLTRVAKAQEPGRRVFRLKHRALVPAPAVAPRRDTATAPRPDTRKRDRLILAGIGALGVIAYASVGFAAMQVAPVYLVSGSPVAYDVDVDGEAVRLAPGAVLKRHLGFAPRQLLVHAPAGTRTVDVDFGVSPLTAPYHLLRTKVLNPDGLAVIVREEIEYSTRFKGDSSDNGRHEFSVLTGTLIDAQARFAFEPYPATIEMKGSSQMVSRISVDGSGPFAGTALLRAQRGDAAARAHAFARLAWSANDVDALDVILDEHSAQAGAPGADDTIAPEVAAAVDAVIAARPVDVEGWLRVRAAGLIDDEDVDALVAAIDGDDGDADPCAAYVALLLGVDVTPARTKRASGCINEQLEAGIRAGVDGDIDGARAVLDRVPTSRLTPYRFQRWSLLAVLLRERALLEERVRTSVDPTSFATSDLRLGLMLVQNDLVAAKELRREALDGVDDDGATAAYFDFVFAYNRGAVDDAAAGMATLPDSLRADYDFERILVTGGFAEESEHIATHGVDDQLLYWAALLAREPGNATARHRLSALLADLDPSWPREAPAVAGLRVLGGNWPLRRASALALAVLHRSSAFLDEAERLCRPTNPPSLLVRQLRAR